VVKVVFIFIGLIVIVGAFISLLVIGVKRKRDNKDDK
jgi:hypothetical protein